MLEVLLWLVLAWQAVALAQALRVGADTMPAAIADMQAPPQAAPYALRHDPFHVGASPMASVTQASGFRLHGVRHGHRPSAILADAQGVQSSRFQGEDVAPGVRLLEVGIDHVVLRTATGSQRLDMDDAATPAPVTPASPTMPPAAAAPLEAPARALSEAALQPRRQDGRVHGYAVPSSGVSSLLLRQAGLQPGDVITAVDGQALTAERHGDLRSAFAGQRQLQLSVERDGQPITVTVGSASP